ncbi:MAG: YybH family protein, partial [Vicinamibacteria bacterium]
ADESAGDLVMGDRIMRALAIGWLVTLTAAALSAQEATVEQAIDAIAQKYSEAWKAGDAAGCASIYSDDADVIDFMGMSAKGQAAIQESITQTLTTTYTGSSIQIVRTGIHVVSADVVVSDGTWEITGAKAAEGAPSRGFYTVVVAKQGDAWQVVSGRTKVAPSMN